ncbi:MAG: hypothetical protein ACJ78R_10555 [Gemmatimonadaceae bacterium]
MILAVVVAVSLMMIFAAFLIVLIRRLALKVRESHPGTSRSMANERM